MNQSSSAPRYLAINLLALRKRKNLTQSQIADLADIPRSTITHMESGVGNPSLTNLCKLAAAMNVSIEELLARPRNECTLMTSEEVPALQRAAGKVLVHKLMPDKVRGMNINRVEIQPYCSMSGRPHLNGTKEYLMTLAGEVVVSVGGDDYKVAAGDVLAFPGDQNHAYRNDAGNEAVALSVVLPVPLVMER